MFRKSQLRVIGAALLFVTPAFVGCDKLKSAAARLEKTEKPEVEGPRVQGTYSRDQVCNLTQSDFAAFTARKNALVIVDFHAEWCGPCKMLGPVLEEATVAYPGVVYVGRVNVDQVPALASQMGVSGIPDVRIFRDGKEVDRFVGFPGQGKVLERISELSAGIVPAAAPVASAPVEPSIKPFTKDWLPPGMSRQKSTGNQRP